MRQRHETKEKPAHPPRHCDRIHLSRAEARANSGDEEAAGVAIHTVAKGKGVARREHGPSTFKGGGTVGCRDWNVAAEGPGKIGSECGVSMREVDAPVDR